MIGAIIKPELIELIRERGFGKLRDVLLDFEPVEIAEIFGSFEPEDQAIFLRILPSEVAADVFEYLEIDQQEPLLHALGTEAVAEILNEMDPDDRTAVFEVLPSTLTQRLLNLLDPTERQVAVRLLGYPDDSVGRLMTPEYVAVREEWTVLDVLAELRRVGSDRESFNQMFVLGEHGELRGVVRLRNLITADTATQVQDLVETQLIALPVTLTQEEAVDIFQKYDRTILPVVDSTNLLLGVVTVDDILDVAEEAATEDIQKMGAVEALEAPYMTTGIGRMFRKRAGWLTALFLGQSLTVFAMQNHRSALEAASALALFLPLIISSGGNTGSQTSTLVVRALGTNDVALGDVWRVIRRELITATALGFTLGALSFALVTAFHGMIGASFLAYGVAVSLSVLCVVLFGGLAGAAFPFALSRLGFDPAVCSTPFVTTVVDVTGLIIYLTLASAILRGMSA